MRKQLLIILLVVSSFGTKVSAQDDFIGVVKLFAGGYAPVNWMYCDGQLLSISEYTALFSIIGTTYGGNGTTNFALPDLRGRVPVHNGTGVGLTPRYRGEKSGQEFVTLTEAQMPVHDHQVTTTSNATEEANTDEPTNNYVGGTGNQAFGTTTDVQLNSNAVQVTVNDAGGGQSHYNMQPYLGISYIICVNGYYPPRN